MKFRDKLGRLPAPLPERAAETKPGLEELRARMAELLGEPLEERSPRLAEDPSFPFVPFPTTEGTVHRLVATLRPSHHVGAIPVDAARDVSMEVLALLALEPRLATVRPEKVLFLDTETTGLSGSGVLPFLVGLAWFDEEGRLVVEQFLLRTPGEEGALLAAVRERLAQSSYLVTYNGKAFDWPLLGTRAVMNRVPPLPELPHLDLLHVARRLHKARLGSCRLVGLEAHVLGFERGEDDVSGADIAPRYAHYLRSGAYAALDPVVTHNAWDIVSMAALVGLYGEPMGFLHPRDLVRAGVVARRGRNLALAGEFLETALERGAAAEAHVELGFLDKARGDRARALAHFEEAARSLAEPRLHLELTKLYEHHERDVAAALAWFERGTGESAASAERRSARLEAKAHKLRSVPGLDAHPVEGPVNEEGAHEEAPEGENAGQRRTFAEGDREFDGE